MPVISASAEIFTANQCENARLRSFVAGSAAKSSYPPPATGNANRLSRLGKRLRVSASGIGATEENSSSRICGRSRVARIFVDAITDSTEGKSANTSRSING